MIEFLSVNRMFQSEKPRKPRKKKKEKDSNKPKKPQSAYMLWLNEMRPKIKAEHPDAAITEIAKIGGKMWGEVKDKTVRTLSFSSRV